MSPRGRRQAAIRAPPPIAGPRATPRPAPCGPAGSPGVVACRTATQLNRAPVAQWIEHRTSNPTVAGSNPAGCATKPQVRRLIEPHGAGGRPHLGLVVRSPARTQLAEDLPPPTAPVRPPWSARNPRAHGHGSTPQRPLPRRTGTSRTKGPGIGHQPGPTPAPGTTQGGPEPGTHARHRAAPLSGPRLPGRAAAGPLQRHHRGRGLGGLPGHLGEHGLVGVLGEERRGVPQLGGDDLHVHPRRKTQ